MVPKDATFMSSFNVQNPLVWRGLGPCQRAMFYVKRRSAQAKNIAKVFLSYTIDNDFTPVCFGANTNGVNHATLANPIMHVSESGCLEYIIKSIYCPMTAEAKSTKINFMVKEVLGESNLRSSV